jgi:arylsulfatase A-like enzyme
LIRDRPLLAAGEKAVDPEYKELIRDLYRGTIRQADENIGKLVEMLERKNVLDETVIVVFGDHGDHLGERNCWGHQFSVADDVIRIPLLIRDPSERLAPVRCDNAVQLNDLYPTVLGMVGAGCSRSQSYDISREDRETAFVYYQTPNSYIERIARNHDMDITALPPTRQFAAWRNPSQRATWYPDQDETTGDTALVDILQNHYASLSQVGSRTSSHVDRRTEQNLRDMGYI